MARPVRRVVHAWEPHDTAPRSAPRSPCTVRPTGRARSAQCTRLQDSSEKTNVTTTCFRAQLRFCCASRILKTYPARQQQPLGVIRRGRCGTIPVRMHCEHRVHRSAPNFHVPGGSHVLGVPPCCGGGRKGLRRVAARLLGSGYRLVPTTTSIPTKAMKMV